MLCLYTGTPGAGKSLYSVWEVARKIPGSTLEVNGEAVPRKLFSNIKDLLVEHEVIGPDEMNTWQSWVKPGDVIIYDEVQEVWRPRASGSKVPEAIAALEVHRHKGVDIHLITQHPQLLDQNVRRLVNQHIHLRRVTKKMAMVYEWDHCSNVSSMKSAIQSKLWHHPTKAYALYKSAQAHTKPTQRLPRVVWLGAVVLIAGAVMFPKVAQNMQRTFKGEPLHDAQAVAGVKKPAASAAVPPVPAPVPASAPGVSFVAAAAKDKPSFQGCIRSATDCKCLDASGEAAVVDKQVCLDKTGYGREVFDLGADTPRATLSQQASDMSVLSWMAYSDKKSSF